MKCPATMAEINREIRRRGSSFETLEDMEIVHDLDTGLPFMRLHVRLKDGSRFSVDTFEPAPLIEFAYLDPRDTVAH